MKKILVILGAFGILYCGNFSVYAAELTEQSTVESIIEDVADDTENIIEGQITTEEAVESGEKLYEESLDQILESLDFGEINDFLNETALGESLTFVDLLKTLIAQEGQVDKGWFFSEIWGILASELQANRPIFIQILVMCVAFALLNNFAMVFKNSQIHQTCFFIYYMALITLLMKSYLISSQLLTSVLEELIGFMQALIPAFCMSLAFTTAISTATVFYQIILAAIYLIERILIHVILPGVHIYVVLMMLNLLTEEKLISGITNLIKKVISWSLKVMVGAITGINVLQNLIAPAVDSLKNTAVTKAFSVIPGIGSAANAVTDMFLGSAVVIKNGVGVTALVILLILSLAPLLKLAFLTFLYKLTGALVQPVADKRVCGCINGVGEGVKLLLKILGTALLMFMISIAMVTASVR